MSQANLPPSRVFALAAIFVTFSPSTYARQPRQLGLEHALEEKLNDGAEFSKKLKKVREHGDEIFGAAWTKADGQGRPLTNGKGGTIADPNDPLVGARRMNSISGPDASSCAGCHNKPFDGGGGDFSSSVFVLSERFDHISFDASELTSLKGEKDENGQTVNLKTVGNLRASIGLGGSGYIELLARQITEDLQTDRDSLAPGASIALVSERTGNLEFGTLSRDAQGVWDTSAVVGLPSSSTASTGPSDPPSLIVKPFHQSGAVVSLRQFANNALNQHHGIQSSERFGAGIDADGDGIADELGIADVTALTLDSAQYPVPGRVIPRDKALEEVIRRGEDNFKDIGCVACHVPELPLASSLFTEPNPFNPKDGNLDPTDAYVATYGTFAFDLNDATLDGPRLKANSEGITFVPAFTDLKLHDITDPNLTWPLDENEEPLDMELSPPTLGHNARFLTKKLWGFANEPPYFHHGRYTTIREAIEAHKGEAAAAAAQWSSLSADDKDSVIEFLKTLQGRPADSKNRIVDENGKPRKWQKFAAKDFD